MNVIRITLLLFLCTALFVSSEETQKKIASVWVNSSPEGADVFVDNSFVGNAPAVLKIEAGKHEIRISLNGYEDWKRTVEILADSELTLNPTLQKKQESGVVAPESEPSKPGIQFDAVSKLKGKQFYVVEPIYARLTIREPVLHFAEGKGKYYTLFAPNGLTVEFRDYDESKNRYGKLYREQVVIRSVDWSTTTATLIVDAVNKPRRNGLVHFRFSSDKAFWKLFNQCFATSLS